MAARPTILCLLIVLFAGLVSLPAGEGTVLTRDRRMFEGHLRLERGAVTVINVSRDLLLRIPETNVQRVLLRRSFESSEPVIADTAPDGEPPPPWRHISLGPDLSSGGIHCTGGGWRVWSRGTTTALSDQAGHFVFQPVSGNCDLVGRLRWLSPPKAGAAAGLLLRDSLRRGGAGVFVGLVSPQDGALRWRDAGGREGEVLFPFRPPRWLRLRRLDTRVATYVSTDGRQWELIEKVPAPLGESAFVGLTVSALAHPQQAVAVWDGVRQARHLTFHPQPPQVELRSGSVLAGALAAADAREVRFAGPLPRAPVSLRDVANVRFRGLPGPGERLARSGRSGLVLAGGEFLEAEFRGITDGFALTSSVLFGLRQFECDTEIAAIILHKPATTQHPCDVKTTDGSTWMGRELRLGENEVILHEPLLGLCRIPVHELSDFGWR